MKESVVFRRPTSSFFSETQSSEEEREREEVLFIYLFLLFLGVYVI